MNSGNVLTVREQTKGSELIADAAIGATTLILEDATDFVDDGGDLQIVEEDGTTTELSYSAADDEAGIVTLDAPLAAAFVIGDRVQTLPLITEHFAEVMIEDADETMTVRVPHDLWAALPLGTRDPDADELELVTVTPDANGELVIGDVEGRVPVLDGSYTDPATLPPPTPSDGNPPVASPTPSVIPGLRSLFVVWPPIANPDLVTYEVHASPTTGFTPSAATYIGEGVGDTVTTIEALTDGSALVPGTTYFVRIVAKDLDGTAPASAEASGSPAQATSPDIAVNAIIADHLLANEALFEKLRAVLIITNTLKTHPDENFGLELDAEGFRVYDPGGSLLVHLPGDGSPATFAGNVIADFLTVVTGMSVAGVSRLETNAVMELQSSLQGAFTPPVLTRSWQTLAHDAVDGARYGMFYDANGSAAGGVATYLVASAQPSGGNDFGVTEIRASDGVKLREVLYNEAFASPQVLGCARLGSHVFVLARTVEFPNSGNLLEPRWWLYKFTQAGFAFVSKTNITAHIPAGYSYYSGGWYDQRFFAAITADATHLHVATHAGTGADSNVRFARFTEAPAFVDAVTGSGRTFTNQPYAALAGVVKEAGGWWVMTAYDGDLGGGRASFFNTSGVYQTNRDFRAPDASGFAYDSAAGRFVSLAAASALLRFHTSFDWTTEPQKFWVAFTWYDATLGETQASTLGSIDMTDWRRARVQIVAPDFPATVTGIRVYALRQTAVPAAADLKRQVAPTYVTVENAPTTLLVDYDGAGAAPPVVSGFGGEAAELRSAVAGTEAGWALHGDGRFFLPKVTIAQRNTLYPSDLEAALIYNEDNEAPQIADSLGWKPGSPIPGPTGFWIYDDFFSPGTVNPGPFGETISGTGASVQAVTAAGRQGVWEADTGTTSAGLAIIRSGVPVIHPGQGELRFGAVVSVRALSTATDRFVVFAGLDDTQGGWSSVGAHKVIGFRYQDALNSGKWSAFVNDGDGGAASVLDSGIAVVANAWFLLEYIVRADGSRVDFWVNETYIGFLDTNLPGTAGLGLMFGIQKNAGTAVRTAWIDALWLYGEDTSKRYG